MKLSRVIGPVLVAMLLAACGEDAPRITGTLEWDVVRLPATAAERIVEIAVREGDAVREGQLLLRLDATRVDAELAAAQAQALQAAARVEELQAGPRREQRDAARARLERARSLALDAQREYARVDAIVDRGLMPVAERDRTRAAFDAAQSEVETAAAQLAELENGTRSEQIAQAQAALAAAQAQVRVIEERRADLDLHAPRDGVVDSLPLEAGDRPAVGAALVTLLVGDAPYARVYVPEPLRAGIGVGDVFEVHVDGVDAALSGRVRTLAREASFTPYFALTGDDAARLSYLAEIALGADAAALPAGLPLTARRPDADDSD